MSHTDTRYRFEEISPSQWCFFLICCLNKALQRPETKLPVTYQTFALVWTPILAWFRKLYFEWFYERWVEKGGPEAREGVIWELFAMAKIRRIGHDHQPPFFLGMGMMGIKRDTKPVSVGPSVGCSKDDWWLMIDVSGLSLDCPWTVSRLSLDCH